jgi:hypothetical protein
MKNGSGKLIVNVTTMIAAKSYIRIPLQAPSELLDAVQLRAAADDELLQVREVSDPFSTTRQGRRQKAGFRRRQAMDLELVVG